MGKLRAWTSVAALLEIHQWLGHIPAPPYGKLHVPAWERTHCHFQTTTPTEFSSFCIARLVHRSHSGVLSVCAELLKCEGCLSVQLKAHTLPGSLSPRSEALFSGSPSHKTWSTEKERRQEQQYLKKMNCECVCVCVYDHHKVSYRNKMSVYPNRRAVVNISDNLIISVCVCYVCVGLYVCGSISNPNRYSILGLARFITSLYAASTN